MLGIDVVLVEADTDVLGLDLDELGEGVLQPASDRDAAAQRGVGIGKLVPANLAGGVDAGAGLIDNDIGQLGEQRVGRMRAGGRLGRGRALRRRVLGLRRPGSGRVGFPAVAPTRARKGGLEGAAAAGALAAFAGSCLVSWPEGASA